MITSNEFLSCLTSRKIPSAAPDGTSDGNMKYNDKKEEPK